MLDGWNLGSVSSVEEVGWNMLRETFSSVLVSGNVTQEDPHVVGPARLGLRLYVADRYYLLISTTAIAIEGVGRTQPTAVADETTTVVSEYDVVGAVQRNQPATPLRVAATSSMVAITLPVAIPSGTTTIQTSVATLSSSSIMMSGNSSVLVPDDASTTTLIPKEPIRVGPALIDVVPAIVTVRQGASCVLHLTALAPWQSAPAVVGINVTVFGSALSVNATRLVLAPSANLEVVAPVSAPLGPALLRLEPETVGTALPGRRWVTVVAHDDMDPKKAERASLAMDNAHLPVHKASTPSADFRIKSDDSDRHRRVAQDRGSLESDEVVPATDMDAPSSSIENDICTQDAPCVYRGRGCNGANMFEIGRTTSYTMAQCLALCRATNGCEGFVFDAIANESKSQCKVAKLPADQACCLMKRACSPGAHKQGDTAVSFKPVPPPAPLPAPPNPAQKQWCPAYHAIHSANLCDPSGPIQTPDGLWHIFDDYVAKRPSWISAVVLVDGGMVESFTDSSVDMSVDASGSLSNGAATTRSFLPNVPPFDLQGGTSGRGVYLSALPAGVGCQVTVADLALQDANAVLKTDDESTGDGGPEIPAETPKPGAAPLPSRFLEVLVGGTVRKLALYDEVRLKSKLKTDDDGCNQIVVAQCEESQREDCTAALQGAFDRAAAMPRASGDQVTVMVPPLSGGASWTIAGVAAGGQWRGIRLNASHSDMVVILQPRAVLEAKRGSFKPEYAPFLDLFNVSQLRIVGYGAAIKMWRADYNDTAKGYAASEDRHGISVERSRNVHIEGLTVDSSGGDGLIIAPGKCAPSEPKCYAREQLGLYPQCYNITVRDCVFTRNRRQGMSVIGGVGVLVENTLFNSTGSDGLGTAPMAGVDVSLPAAISVVLLQIVQ